MWFKKPVLLPNEHIRWKRAANREQGGWRAVGGMLYLTNMRLCFEPNAVDRRLYGMSWTSPLNRIVSVDPIARSSNPITAIFSGGIRRRLQITLSDNTTERFVVNNVEDVVALLATAHIGCSNDISL